MLTDAWQYGSFVLSVAVRGAEIIPSPVIDQKRKKNHAQILHELNGTRTDALILSDVQLYAGLRHDTRTHALDFDWPTVSGFKYGTRARDFVRLRLSTKKTSIQPSIYDEGPLWLPTGCVYRILSCGLYV